MFTKHLVGLVILSSTWGWLCASARDNHAIPPYQRVLNPAQAKQVAELEKAIDRLSAAAKFAEALQPAEEVLTLLIELGQAGRDAGILSRSWIQVIEQAACAH